MRHQGPALRVDAQIMSPVIFNEKRSVLPDHPEHRLAPLQTPYLAVISMFLGFFAWYRGLAIGPITQVSQVQLIQPVMAILWAALILGEQISISIALGGFAVILCAGLAVRTRLYGKSRP